MSPRPHLYVIASRPVSRPEYARHGYIQAEPKPRALSLREFLLLAAAAMVLGLLLGCDGEAAAVTAQLEAEAQDRKAVRPEACIQTYGPGERWFKHQHVYECVTAARELPSSLLTHPLRP